MFAEQIKAGGRSGLKEAEGNELCKLSEVNLEDTFFRFDVD